MKKRFFEDWKIDRHCVYNDDYCFWICNGFAFFDDHYDSVCGSKCKPFILLVGFWDRLRLWNEFKREKKLRTKDLLANL